MLDRKSYKLLKIFYKKDFLSDDQINTMDIKKTVAYLERKKFITLQSTGERVNGVPIHDGYDILPEGRAYVENRRRQFLMFILPYGITTFIALLSLFTSISK